MRSCDLQDFVLIIRALFIQQHPNETFCDTSKENWDLGKKKPVLIYTDRYIQASTGETSTALSIIYVTFAVPMPI